MFKKSMKTLAAAAAALLFGHASAQEIVVWHDLGDNGIKWFLPEISPGDLILFPSYLLHEVPANQGAQRISIAFNAIPDRLDSSGYAIRLSK